MLSLSRFQVVARSIIPYIKNFSNPFFSCSTPIIVSRPVPLIPSSCMVYSHKNNQDGSYEQAHGYTPIITAVAGIVIKVSRKFR
jgi:hypothetical protein